MKDAIYKRILKNKMAQDNRFFSHEKKTFISTASIITNLLFSGRVDGGILRGAVNQIAAPSSLLKSFIAYITLKNAQKQGMFAVVIDAEKAFDWEFAQKIGIDISDDALYVMRNNRIEDITEFIMSMIEGVPRAEQYDTFVLLDSLNALVTSKTVTDATENKDTADFTDAKKKNRLAKLLMGSNLTIMVINHVYDTMDKYDPFAIPGGRGFFFASQNILLGTSRAKEKEDDEISGMIVTYHTRKGRDAKEFSKGHIRVKHKGGIDLWYGLLDHALEGGFVEKPSNGWYTRPSVPDDKKWRQKEIYNEDFWLPLFQVGFKEYLEEKFGYNGEINIDQPDWNKIDQDDEKSFMTKGHSAADMLDGV